MRSKFPTIAPVTSIDPKKITRSNMDNVVNSLLLYINLNSFNGHTSLSATVTITYNRIQVMFNEDPVQTLNTLKTVRKWFIEYVRGNTLPNPGIRAWFWDSTANRPIFLSNAIELLNEAPFLDNPNRLFAVRVFVALLSLDRVMVLHGTPKYDTITNPGTEIDVKSDTYPVDIRGLVNNLGFTPEDFAARFAHEVSVFRYTVLSSAGPNGDSTWTAHSDARAWVSSKSQFLTLKTFAMASGLDSILGDLLSVVSIKPDEGKAIKDLALSKIHSFDEWGGKVRSVAIVDYWTQMLLTPLHNTINYFLRRIDMDGTYNQLRIADIVRGWTGKTGVDVYSYDLSAATDRLPISLQVEILSELLGNNKLANAWKALLIDRDFVTADGVKLRYAVGQPMGARSSFPMLALTHHIIVQHAARMAGVNDFTDYVVLGDDMSMANGKVASKYRLIMKLLGVEINDSKSIVHLDGVKSAAEICKRVFIEGDEITSLNPKLIAKTVRLGSLGPSLQDDLSLRGINLSGDFVLSFFYELLDKESFKELMLLNSIPSSVSGIKSPVTIPGLKYAEISNWYPGLKDFSAKTIENIFTYTAAVEALKRLDALLRQTLAIGTAISQSAGLFSDGKVSVVDLWTILGIPTDVRWEDVKLIETLTMDLAPNHPIIKASESEIERITELVSGLISVDTEMYNRSRNGLLDIMRNALVDIWQDESEARAAAGRTLFTKSLNNVKLLVSKGTTYSSSRPDTPIYNPSDMRLEYTITLSQIQRQWIVRVGLVDGVTINAVISRVSPSAYVAQAKARHALQDVTF